VHGQQQKSGGNYRCRRVVTLRRIPGFLRISSSPAAHRKSRRLDVVSLLFVRESIVDVKQQIDEFFIDLRRVLMTIFGDFIAQKSFERFVHSILHFELVAVEARQAVNHFRVEVKLRRSLHREFGDSANDKSWQLQTSQ
jgi:hypothetical protein